LRRTEAEGGGRRRDRSRRLFGSAVQPVYTPAADARAGGRGNSPEIPAGCRGSADGQGPGKTPRRACPGRAPWALLLRRTVTLQSSIGAGCSIPALVRHTYATRTPLILGAYTCVAAWTLSATWTHMSSSRLQQAFCHFSQKMRLKH